MVFKKRFSRIFLSYVIRDALNLLRYGIHAPKSAQLIWLNPAAINRMVAINKETNKRMFMPRRQFTGRILGGDWDVKTIDFANSSKYIGCYDRYVKNISWEETALVKGHLKKLRLQGRHSKGNTKAEILFRYAQLDDLYATAIRDGLATRKQIHPEAFREEGGIYVHLSRDGSPIFGGGGFHRLAIAKLLNLDLIPAQLGVVHKHFWKRDGRLPKSI